jgi:hypothetical protein
MLTRANANMTTVVLVCAGLATLPALASAQAARPQGRFEISGSIGLAGSHDLGTEKATEPGNGVPSGSPVTLFQAASTLERGPLFDARVAWRLTRSLAAEGTFGIVRTHLRTSITNDFEQAPATVATSRLTQYTAEGGLVWHLDRLRFAHGRVRPFVTGGGGYLRQLHDQGTLVETGESAFAGGGIKIQLHETAQRLKRPFLKSLGLRADVRVNFTHGGFDIDETAWRTYPTLTGGVYVCF